MIMYNNDNVFFFFADESQTDFDGVDCTTDSSRILIIYTSYLHIYAKETVVVCSTSNFVEVKTGF